MDDSTSHSPLGRERPLITAVVLPGGVPADSAALREWARADAAAVDVRILVFSTTEPAPEAAGDPRTVVMAVAGDQLADLRVLRRKAVSETTGEVYRFIPKDAPRRATEGSLAERLRLASVPHPEHGATGAASRSQPASSRSRPRRSPEKSTN